VADRPFNQLAGALVRPELATFVLLGLAVVVSSSLSPYFGEPSFILDSSTYYVELCIVALVLTLVIVAGEIDLSAASMMALASCIFGIALAKGLHPSVAIGASLLAGVVMGAFNGYLVAALGLPSLIVTIGTLILFRGIAQVLVGDESLSGFPAWFLGIDRVLVFGIPLSVLLFVAVALVTGFILARSIGGRWIYQVGTNPDAARHSGIRVNRIRFFLFVAMGLISAVAGLMAASRLGSVRYDLATGGELQIVLIVMLGGTYIYGGRGSILGTFIASWLVVIIATGMTVANIAINSQLTVFGLLLVIALVGADAIRRRQARNRSATGQSQKVVMVATAGFACATLAMLWPFVFGAGKGHTIAADGDAPVSITLIPKNTGNPYFDSITAGFLDACAELRCTFATVGPATAEATSQIPFVSAQVQRRVDAVAIAPNSPSALNAVFDRARERGTLVISINSDMPGYQDRRDAAILPVDFSRVGPAQIELMGKLINYKGKIAILSATTDAPDQNSWIGDMQQALELPKYSDMRLVKIAYGNDDPQKSTTETEALLANYPDLRGIISPTTVGVAAAAQVVETARKSDQVKVTGLGTPNQMRRFVKNGTVSAFQLWSPYNEGLLAAHLITGVEAGTLIIAPGATFEVPELGTITIRDQNVIHTQPDLTTFDISNIDDFHF
jgi:rhamnose transport system substrate-binding protein